MQKAPWPRPAAIRPMSLDERVRAAEETLRTCVRQLAEFQLLGIAAPNLWEAIELLAEVEQADATAPVVEKKLLLERLNSTHTSLFTKIRQKLTA